MSKTRVLLCLAIIFICSITTAFGYVMGSTNFNISGYPEFIQKYYRPTKPYSKDSYSMQRYRSEMEHYLQDAKSYNEAANNDIQRILDSMYKAQNEVNDAIEEYNRFVQTGY